jgi:hypothetical protein
LVGSLGLRFLQQLIKNKENRGNFFNKRAELNMMVGNYYCKIIPK